MVQTINSLLILYCWIVVAILTLFLFLIGRFCELKLGRKSRYQFFLLPLALLLIAGVWYAFFAQSSSGGPIYDFVGSFWPDLLYLIGGLVLIVLCYSLHRTMMGDQK